MVTRGGEVDFVRKMIDESLHLRDRIQWYTSMVGKMSSVSVLVETLIKHGNHNFAVTEFDQGAKTKRWAVAWSWGDRRPPSVCQMRSHLPRLYNFPSCQAANCRYPGCGEGNSQLTQKSFPIPC